MIAHYITCISLGYLKLMFTISALKLGIHVPVENTAFPFFFSETPYGLAGS